MQLAQIVHGVVAVLFVAAMLGHIYIGTIGMEGAFEAMGDGTVDVNWAKQHHSLWLDEEQAKAARRIGAPASPRRSDAGRIGRIQSGLTKRPAVIRRAFLL